MTQNNIDDTVLNKNFSTYKNDFFIKVNQETSYEYGLSYHYNYYYPPESALSFQYMGEHVVKAGFAVGENNSINQVVLYLNLFDATKFYVDLVEKYGMPGTSQLSKFYIENHGFKIPPQLKDYNERYYDSLPPPKVEDFKVLQSLTWYDVNVNENRIKTNLIVRNRTKPSIFDQELHKIEVIFRK